MVGLELDVGVGGGATFPWSKLGEGGTVALAVFCGAGSSWGQLGGW